MKAQIASLQEQVNIIFANLSSARAQGPTPASTERYPPQSLSPNDRQQSISFSSLRNNKPPTLHGPISAAYGLDVAKHSLASMGITTESGADGEPSDQPSPERSIDPELTAQAAPPHYDKDPLWSIKREEAIRLLQYYDEEIGVTYPIFPMENMLKHVDLLWAFIEAALRTGFMPGNHVPGADALDDDDTNLVKITLANTLTFEDGGNELGHRLFNSVVPQLERKVWQSADLKSIKLIALASMWYFHQDNETMSWRLIGVAGRMCMELGLHRKDAIDKAFPTSEEKKWALNVFWAVHSFDRRWSLGTGLPFTIPDDDIDPQLPRPEGAYPLAMYGFHGLISKVWYSTLRNEAEPKREEMEYLDYQIRQWYRDISPELQLDPSNIEEDIQKDQSGVRRLRVLVYMRTNSARLSVYRPILQSATSIIQNRDYARTAVDIAKDTISLLARINHVSDVYRTQQVRFNHFLINALAALFLAVCHAPAEFSRDVRQEFYMATDLVKGFGAKSSTSKRLWKTIRELRNLFHKLDTFKSHEGDPHSNAAIAMAGLAGQPVDNVGYNNHASLGSSPFDGMQMSNELTQLFEMAGGSNNTGSIWAGLEAAAASQTNQYPESLARQGNSNAALASHGFFGYEDEFSKIMSQIF